MKTRTLICSLLALGFLAGANLNPAAAKDKSKAVGKPKITKAEAKKIALAKVPNGKVKETELEMEHEKLIWSLDIATRGSKEITEVHVDALNGEVLAVEKEAKKSKSSKGKKSKKSSKGKNKNEGVDKEQPK